MRAARKLLVASLSALGLAALPVTAAHALLVKVSINFGPTITGPDNGTLVITANPGDRLLITWALGTDADISLSRILSELTSSDRYHGDHPRHGVRPRAHRPGLRPVRQSERPRFGGFRITRFPTELPSASR